MLRLFGVLLMAAVAIYLVAAVVIAVLPWIIGGVLIIALVTFVAGLLPKLPEDEKKGLQPPDS